MLYMSAAIVLMFYMIYRMYATLKDKFEQADDTRILRPHSVVTFLTIFPIMML